MMRSSSTISVERCPDWLAARVPRLQQTVKLTLLSVLILSTLAVASAHAAWSPPWTPDFAHNANGFYDEWDWTNGLLINLGG
jgi:hypothetical protein